MNSKDPRHISPLVAASLAALAAFVFPFAPARALCRPESLLVVHSSLPIDFLPRNIVVADFNGDGIQDLAIATTHWNPPNRDAIAVLLGNGANRAGDGSFREPVYYDAGRDPVAVAVADFDGDHVADLAVLDRTPGSVSILRGAGDGTFALRATLDTGPNPIDLVAGDFRKDGFADLAVLHNLYGLRILAGSATGVFSVTQNLALGTSTGNLIAADFNRDGILDLAFAQAGPTIGVVLGRGTAGAGDGTFAARTTYGGAGAFDVADMNRDGIPDLVMGGGGTIMIALGDPGPGFLTPGPITPAYSAGSVRVADLDGDGFPDIVAGIGPSLYVFSGQGAGYSFRSFADPAPIATGSIAQCLAFGDFDADGRLDVAAGRLDEVGNAPRLDVLLGHCNDSPAPILDVVADMPNDQGGRLRLSWRRSGQDGLAGSAVTSYTVYRRDPGADSWQVAGSVPATKLNSYGFIANAVQDSTPAGAPATSFYVSALTADPAVHYDSEPRSGCSKDNLAPAMPDGFTGALAPGGGVRLSWAPVAAPDLRGYRVHRVPLTTLPPAPPGASNLIATPVDAGFLDDGASTPSGVLWYWIAAEDVHGNVGPYSQLQLFTGDCRREVNQVLNNTSHLALASSPVRAGALGADPPGGPPVKKPDRPPPPYVTSYGTSLDVPVQDAYGTGRASYDLRAAMFHADAAASGYVHSVEVMANDSYRVTGPAAGTPLTLRVELKVQASRLDDCAATPCGGTAEAAIYSAGARAAASLDLTGNDAGRDTTLSLLLTEGAEAPFTIYADVFAAAAGAVSTDGWLRFSGLPEGAAVTSCAGYDPGARTDRRFARAPAGRGPAENGGARPAPGLEGRDARDDAAATPRLALAAPALDPSGALRFTLTLPAAQRASLQVFDLAGRRLLRRDIGELGPGEHNVELAAARSWPAGLYVVSVAQGDRTLSRRFAIVR